MLDWMLTKCWSDPHCHCLTWKEEAAVSLGLTEPVLSTEESIEGKVGNARTFSSGHMTSFDECNKGVLPPCLNLHETTCLSLPDEITHVNFTIKQEVQNS